jgi:hypothetical protein
MNAQEKPVTVRFPLELYERLMLLAKQERRSFNAQVVYLVEKAVEGDGNARKA